jgi:DNA-binding response OmpR family regulator
MNANNHNSKTVLVIEDHDDIRESIVEILELAGYHVLNAPEGRSGFELALKHLPHIILCDIMMPVLDGYGVLYLLGKHEETANIPLIFLTAKAERVDVRKAMEMGADDYLIKPFDDMELLNAIESRLRKHSNKRNISILSTSLPEDLESLLEELTALGRKKTYKKKQSIYQELDTPLYLYKVNSGKVRSFLFYDDGRELTTGIYSENEFFGYEAILLDKKRFDNIETLEETELTLIGKADLENLMQKRYALNMKFIQLLTRNNQLKNERLLSFAYNSVRKRIAEAIVNYAEKFRKTPNDNFCVIRVSRDDLASMAGTANETVSRTLADFKEENLLSKEGNSIHIIDIEALKAIN